MGNNYEIGGYTEVVGVGFCEGHSISKKEIDEIIEKYYHFFATDTSLQNCTYGVHKLEGSEK